MRSTGARRRRGRFSPSVLLQVPPEESQNLVMLALHLSLATAHARSYWMSVPLKPIALNAPLTNAENDACWDLGTAVRVVLAHLTRLPYLNTEQLASRAACVVWLPSRTFASARLAPKSCSADFQLGWVGRAEGGDRTPAHCTAAPWPDRYLKLKPHDSRTRALRPPRQQPIYKHAIPHHSDLPAILTIGALP